MKNYGRYFMIICMLLIISIYLVMQLPHQNSLISFLNIGQGDSIFLRTSDDYTVLIDGGPDPTVLDELAKVMPIYNKTIDILVLTHPHADHVNGLVEVIKRYKIEKLLIVGTPSKNAFYQELLRITKRKNIEVIFANSQKDFRVGSNVFLDIIWPIDNQEGIQYENLNNASVAMRVILRNIKTNKNTLKNMKILLTGDAEIEEETEILESGFDISADILKAGHHGSRTASSEAFLQKSNPQIMVIQSGVKNSFGHPHKETLAKAMAQGIQVRRNDLEGKIDFIFSRY